MASKGSHKKTSTTGADPFVSPQRKMEVLGLILMVLALLLALAFVTYTPADDAIATSVDLGDALLDPGAHQSQFRVENALGLVGAELARLLVPGFLGYTVLLLTGLLAVWGYAVFRHLELRPYAYLSALAVLSTFMLSCLVGWFGHALDTDLIRWSGVIGMGVSGWMQRVFGMAGSFILLLLSIAVALLLVVDHDIQRSIDRVVALVQSVRDRIRSAWSSFQERRSRRRSERTAAREEAREAREARRQRQQESTGSGAASGDAPPSPRAVPPDSAQEASDPGASDPGASEARASEPRGSEPGAPASESAASESAAPESSAAGPSSAEAPDAPGAGVTGGDTVPLSLSPGDRPSPLRRRNDLFRPGSGGPEDASSPDAGASDAGASNAGAGAGPAGERASGTGAEGTGQDVPKQDAPKQGVPEQNVSEQHPPPDASRPDPPGTASGERGLDALEEEFSEAFDEAAFQQDADSPGGEDGAGGAGPASRATASPAAAPEADAAPEEDPEDDPEDDDVELTVKERVEEEKADEIERDSETPDEVEYETPSLELLDAPTDDDPSVDMDELEENKRVLLDKLKTYNIEIQEINAVVGPTVTRYEMIPAPGIKVSRIKSLEDDLAMAMAAQGVRMIAPIPGKSAVGVELANRNRELVRLRDVIGTAKFRDTDMELPVPLGKTIEGEVFLADLTKMPHLLIAGATGSGKSVGLNGLITGLIYACHPSNLKFVIIDPKKIELQQYTHLRDHFMAQPEDLDEAVITEVDEALGVLKSCEKEMEERYDLLSEAGVRGVQQYNRTFNQGDLPPADGHRHMPYIVVVVDEMADLMMQTDKDVEGPIARLAQKARAVGIHLVLATQRPSVDVITGLIKANFPSRIAYEVASRVDSRTILDQIGAEGLVGNGDMLYLSGSTLKRIQGPFVSVEEVERVVDFIADQDDVGTYTLPSLSDAGHGPDSTLGVEDTDDKFEEGARVIVRRQQGSVSLLQRKLAVGYTRAARIVDQLEEAGIVGPFNGTKAREVLVESEEELERLLSGDDLDDEAASGTGGAA